MILFTEIIDYSKISGTPLKNKDSNVKNIDQFTGTDHTLYPIECIFRGAKYRLLLPFNSTVESI